MKVLHTKTQEEWNFVISKFNPRSLASSIYDMYKEKTVIILDGSPGFYGNLSWAQRGGHTIISFEDWCKENGHITKIEIFPRIYIGDVVVSLTYHDSSMRVEGSIHVVRTESSKGSLYYTAINGDCLCSCTQAHWRPTTEEEAKAFKNGVKNINDVLKKVEEMKFEVGKWYKGEINSRIYYIKPSETGNSKIVRGEIITSSYNESDFFSNEDLITTLKLLTDLSEIQSDLPEGHPDKIWIPKKGEWVKVYKTSMGPNYDGSKYLGQVFQISDVKGPSDFGDWALGYKTDGRSPGGIYISDLRPALSSEIPVNKMTTSLLEEAKLKYPVGTEYLFGWSTHKVVQQNFSMPSETMVYAEDGKGCLYYNGEWAEILNKPIDKPIWNVGDCFVVEEAHPTANGHLNFCYKIEDVINNDYLYYEPNSNIKSTIVKCRKATLKETMYYHNVGKPYDINTMPTSFYTKGALVPDISRTGEIKQEEVKWQVGGYVEFLADFGGHKKGSIGRIIKNSDSSYVIVDLKFGSSQAGCALYLDTECKWLGMENPISSKVLIEYFEYTKDIYGKPILTKTPKESVKKGFDEAAYNNSPINQLIKLNIKKPKKVKIRL